VVNSGSNDIWQYAIGKTDGALTKIGATTLPAGSVEPCSITIDSSSTYAYVVDSGSGNVYQYTIGTGGVLDVTSVKTVLAGKSPRSITIHPKGKFAYVVNSGSNEISQYSIGTTDGVLTPLASMSLPAGSAPTSITIATSPSGTYYSYVANSGSTSISQYSFDGGNLQAMTPPTIDVGATPFSIAVDPDGKYAYVANSGNGGSVSQYKITGGGLTPMSTATVSAGKTPRFITVDPSGQYVYAANNGSDNISQYKIDTSGADTNGVLTPIAAAAAADSKPIFVITVAK
jgi:6-phosphogluconolactonase (cycloisomerase 2 family)